MADSHDRMEDPVELEDTPEVAEARRADAEAAAQPQPAAAAPAAAARGWAPPKRGLPLTLFFAAVAIAGALVILYAWQLPPFGNAIQTTDNAFVRGQTTVISPQVSGYVTQVLVQDFEHVHAGDVLVKIDDRIYDQRVQQARAAVATQEANLANWAQSQRTSAAQVQQQQAGIASADAQVVRARADLERIEELAAERSVSLRERDQAVATLRQAEAALLQAHAQHTIAQEQVRTVTVGRGGLEAGVDNARAALRLAEIDLANTVIKAPRDGAVSEVGVRVGQFVVAGSQLLFLVPPVVWVTANFKEAQTARMAPGQPATVRVDALGGARLHGTVGRLAPAAGSEFAVIRPDNATGNFIKVPQRIPVRIELEPAQMLIDRLRPGMSVEVRVDTSEK